MKTSIKAKRLSALYEYKNCQTSSKRDEVLEFLLAIISDNQVKETVEYFDMKIKK